MHNTSRRSFQHNPGFGFAVRAEAALPGLGIVRVDLDGKAIMDIQKFHQQRERGQSMMSPQQVFRVRLQ